MRQCPKCLHLDPPNWRPPPHYPTLDFMRWDEFQEVMPELAKLLQPGKEVEDELYAYHRSKPASPGRPGYVYRVWLPIWRAYGPGGWRAVRASKMYDAEGRLNKESWSTITRIIAARSIFKRTHKNALERYLA